jgi:hypothetical protein
VRAARARATALVFALTLFGGMGGTGTGPPFPPRPLAPAPEQMAALEERRVLLRTPPQTANGSRTGRAEALVLFEQPRDRVLELLAAPARQAEYRPELKRLEVVAHANGVDVVEHEVRFMLTRLRYWTRQTVDREAGRIWWTLDPERRSELAALDGLWELQALDERRTLGRFTTRIDVGPALPAFLQDYATRRRLPEAMELVRRWVDSGGRWRP